MTIINSLPATVAAKFVIIQKQFGPRSGLTQCQACSISKLSDALKNLKNYKSNIEKYLQMARKSLKNTQNSKSSLGTKLAP